MLESNAEIPKMKESSQKLPQKAGGFSSLVVGLATFISSCSPDQGATVKTVERSTTMPISSPTQITTKEPTITPTPLKIIVESNSFKPSQVTVAKLGNITPTTQPTTEAVVKISTAKPDIVVSPNTTSVPDKISTKSPSIESNKWTETIWKENETIPLREWWNDMLKKDLIKLDSLAQRYAGDQINNIINNLDMVPQPKNYYQKQLAYAGNCLTELQELSKLGQGHITINPEVYKQIPGGKDCDVYAKPDK